LSPDLELLPDADFTIRTLTGALVSFAECPYPPVDDASENIYQMAAAHHFEILNYETGVSVEAICDKCLLLAEFSIADVGVDTGVPVN